MIYEYCGTWRTGKTTVMTGDLLTKLLDWRETPYKPDDVFSNYWIDIKGIHCQCDEEIEQTIAICKKKQWYGKIFVVDEASQPPLPFYARGYNRQNHIDIVTSLWQFPKKFCHFLFSDNLGNSVDTQLRDMTMQCLFMTRYNHGEKREDDTIDYSIIDSTVNLCSDENYLVPKLIQDYFDSFKPVV